MRKGLAWLVQLMGWLGLASTERVFGLPVLSLLLVSWWLSHWRGIGSRCVGYLVVAVVLAALFSLSTLVMIVVVAVSSLWIRLGDRWLRSTPARFWSAGLGAAVILSVSKRAELTALAFGYAGVSLLLLLVVMMITKWWQRTRRWGRVLSRFERQ